MIINENCGSDDTGLESLLASMPELTPAEMMASFDPGTWALLRALLETLVSKGVLGVDDLIGMHGDVLKTASSFAEAGETPREDDVKAVAEWLERFTSGRQ